MTPPIFTPDGTEVEEVILPDGSEASEVIAPDGTVVFDAIPAIPDSDDLHARYDFSEYSTNETSNIDDLSGNGHALDNGSISGYTTLNGVQAADFDGEDDAIWTSDFGSSDQVTVAFALDVEDPADEAHHVMQLNTEEASGGFRSLNSVEWYGESVSLDFDFRKVVAFYDDDNNEADIWLDGVDQDIRFSSSGDLSVLGIGSENPRTDRRYTEMSFGELLVYQQDKRDIVDDLFDYLDRWG